MAQIFLRSFASDEEFTRFGDFARAHCEAAKPVVPPIAGVDSA